MQSCFSRHWPAGTSSFGRKFRTGLCAPLSFQCQHKNRNIITHDMRLLNLCCYHNFYQNNYIKCSFFRNKRFMLDGMTANMSCYHLGLLAINSRPRPPRRSKQFKVSKTHLSAVSSKDSLENIIVEKAAVLI